ncbi:MAG: sugar phosphate isomerase/epimerase family protein [Tunicatimonas sp.]
MQRRIFIKRSTLLSAGLGSAGLGLLNSACSTPSSESAAGGDTTAVASTSTEPLYRISLAEWSFHKSLFNPAALKMPWSEFGNKLQNDYQFLVADSKMTNMDFPAKAADMGFEGVEFVNTFFYDKAEDTAYLTELKNKCTEAGVQPLIIMCDAEGDLGDPDEAARQQAVQNHHKWVDAAKFLGCHSIRVNARSSGTYEEQQQRAADGLGKLADYGAQQGVDIVVENHGGLSSNGEWLAGVMQMVNNSALGTLPDFGNFCLEREAPTAENPQPSGCVDEYDRYQGVTELMPYAKAVSAKTHNFNDQGLETETDYEKMMRIVLDAGYRGFVGVEYEGSELGEEEGIRATKELLEQVHTKLVGQYS